MPDDSQRQIFAAELRRLFGDNAAALFLGQTNPNMTEIALYQEYVNVADSFKVLNTINTTVQPGTIPMGPPVPTGLITPATPSGEGQVVVPRAPVPTVSAGDSAYRRQKQMEWDAMPEGYGMKAIYGTFLEWFAFLTEPTSPSGLWKTREEALAAAGNSGYIPVQIKSGEFSGQWALDAPPTQPADKGYGLGYYATKEEVPYAYGYEPYFESGKGWTNREIKQNAPTVFRTEIESRKDGWDYEISYDKNGNKLGEQVVGKTSIPVAKPVRYATVSEGGRDYNVGYDEKNNVVSREYVGQTAKETIAEPTVFRTEIISKPDGYDYEVSYDKDGIKLSERAKQKTVIPITKAVRFGTVSEGGRDYNVGYDQDGNVVSRDYVGQTAKPEVTTPDKTYPLPAGQPQSYVDANGYTWNWDTRLGDYNQAGYTKPPPDETGTTTKPFNTPQEAMAAATAAGLTGYTPVQLSNGLWILQAPEAPAITEPTKTFPLPVGQPNTYTDGNGNVYTWDTRIGDYNITGFDPTKIYKEPPEPTTKPYATPQEAMTAATTAGLTGYVPVQASNGGWYLQAPEAPAPSSTITPYQQAQLDLQQKDLAWQMQQAQPRTYAAPGSTPTATAADIQAWITGKTGGGVYNPAYDINKDKIINMGDVTALQLQPAGGTTGGAGGTSWTDAGGQIWVWDSNTGKYVMGGYDPTKDTSRQMTDYQRQQLALQQQSMNQSASAQAASNAAQSAATAQSAANLAWQQKQAEQELALRKQENLANLAANPKSWLQWNSAGGTTPQIQPWMLPMQPGQYGLTPLSAPRTVTTAPTTPRRRVTIGSGGGAYTTSVGGETQQVPADNTAWQVGQNIPGYTATDMKGMPTLLNPSTQLFARLAPSMQQQYAGYQQAQTGATPEDTAWLLANAAPPAGRNTGFRYQRG